MSTASANSIDAVSSTIVEKGKSAAASKRKKVAVEESEESDAPTSSSRKATPAKKGKKKAVLDSCLLQQAKEGKRAGGTFKDDAWNVVRDSCKAKFKSNSIVTVTKLKAKFQELKRK
ncbi:hypothetical protein DFJ73DRAFT_763475 [Zopfochytrium polystomum]|nr:hypothetical protein DFJ73DRAFT_763475 [Zopfochytrium polystomum]